LKRTLKKLKTLYLRKVCEHCEIAIEPIFRDETSFDSERHGGIYKENPQRWYPHFDVEFICDECGNYEHLTYDPQGVILAQRINKVLFDFKTQEFCVLEWKKYWVAAKVPKNVIYGLEKWQKYLDKAMKKAYPKGAADELSSLQYFNILSESFLKINIASTRLPKRKTV
jgi:hypothetical protein